jgi:hypothetical protein
MPLWQEENKNPDPPPGNSIPHQEDRAFVPLLQKRGLPIRRVCGMLLLMKTSILRTLLLLILIAVNWVRPGPLHALDCADLRVLPIYSENAILIEGVLSNLAPSSGVGKRDRIKNLWAQRAEYRTISLAIGSQTYVATTTSSGILTATATPMVTSGEISLSEQANGRVFARRSFAFPASPTYLLISDVDDTILVSDVAHKLRLAWKTLFRSVRNRQAVPGTPELYRTLVGNPVSASSPLVYYLSASPSALEKFLEKFLERNHFPQGILCLKESFQKEGFSSREYKSRWLRRLKALYPKLPWLLFGDSGELDPEIYLDILETEKVSAKAVIIHEVDGKRRPPEEWKQLHDRATACGVPLIRWRDEKLLKTELIRLGLIGCTDPLSEKPTNP